MNPIRRAMRTIRHAVDSITRSSRRAFIVIFCLAVAVRVALLASWMVPREFLLPDGFSEMGKVAKTLTRSGSFADPYEIPTGPTAHPLPINVGLLSLLYHIFGMTLTAGYVRSAIGIVTFSAMYAMIPFLSGRFGVGRQAGFIGGAVGALIPDQGIGEACGWDFNEQLAAIGLGLLMLVFLRRWSRSRYSLTASLLLGMGFGVAFHLVPALLPVMLGCVAFELWWGRRHRVWPCSATVILGAAIACVPWTWRNYAAFHEFFFLRSNFWLELRVANHDGAAADMEVMDAHGSLALRHPGDNLTEARMVRELGEMEYMRQVRKDVLGWMRRHPGEFCRLTVSRAIHFWCGSLHRLDSVIWVTSISLLALLGARRALRRMTVPQRVALLVPLATFPLVHYVVTYMSRYRVPLNWILLLFAGAELWHWIKQRQVRRVARNG